jgi:hypothetical protein
MIFRHDGQSGLEELNEANMKRKRVKWKESVGNKNEIKGTNDERMDLHICDVMAMTFLTPQILCLSILFRQRAALENHHPSSTEA